MVFSAIWRRPMGARPEEEWVAEVGDDDANIAYSEWMDYIHMPMMDAIQSFQWPDKLDALLNHIVIEAGNGFGIATEFDLPAWARALDMTMVDLMAARATLRRLRVIWYLAMHSPDGIENFTKGFIGINFRFHVWETNPAIVAQISAEETARHMRVRQRPTTAQQALLRTQVSEELRWHIFARDGFKCRYCAAVGVPLTLDHVIPHAKGGQTVADNLVTACRTCNSSKGPRTPEEWQPC